jgi:hypothetical protein
MTSGDDQYDLPYISSVRLVYVPMLAAVLLVTGYLIDTGLYHPTREDELWAMHSRAALLDDQPLDDSTVLSLHRVAGDCFLCPQYSVRVFGSGRVEYVGDMYVCAFGRRESVADAREVRRLVEAMTASGYFGFSWRHGLWGLDAPSATTALRHAGQSYRLYHYLGDHGAPRWLRAMEKEIDRVAGTARWLPTPSTYLCRDPGGRMWQVTMREPSL